MPNNPKTTWDQYFKLLKRYIKREGHAIVPKSHIEDGKKLGDWVARQRWMKDTIPKEHKKALEELPGWAWSANEVKWKKGYDYLLKYVDREGHARVPRRHIEDGYKLGQWIMAIRCRPERLNKKQKKDLEKLPGWVWNAREATWEEGYELLTRYAKREGHTKISYRHVEKGFKLGQWVNNIRGRWEMIPKKRQKALQRLRVGESTRHADGWARANDESGLISVRP
jgi:hypothetical protein